MDQSNDSIFGRRVLKVGTTSERDFAPSSNIGDTTVDPNILNLCNAVSEGSPHYSPQGTPTPSADAAVSYDFQTHLEIVQKTLSFDKLDDSDGMAARDAAAFDQYQFNIGSHAPQQSSLPDTDTVPPSTGPMREGHKRTADDRVASFTELETEDLLNHLRVSEAKNQLLKDKVMEMEHHLEETFLEHSERAKGLTRDINRS